MANVITTVLNLDATKLRTGLKGAQQSIKETDGLVAKAKTGFSTMWSSFASSPVAIAGAGAAVGAFAAKAVNDASNLEESINAVNVAYGNAARGVHALGEQSAESVGLSERAFNELAVQFSAFGEQIASGSGRQVVSVLDEMTTRVADFASVNNLDMAEAARIFQSSLAGETEALRRFGGDVSAAAVEQFALENGLIETKAELTEAIKVQARYGLVMEETAKTAGDFVNTQDSLANQQRILSANVENLSASFGNKLVPVVSDATGILNELIGIYGDLNRIGAEVAPGGASSGPVGRLTKYWSDSITPGAQFAEALDGINRGLGFLNDALGDTPGEFGAFQLVLDNLVTSSTATGEAVDVLGEKIVDLGPRWAASTIPLEAASGAYAELQSEADRAAAAIEATADEADEARTPFDILADAVQGVRDALDEAFGDLEGDLGALDLFDDIQEQFEKVAEAAKEANDPEGVRELNREVRRLQGQLLDYLRTVENIPPDKVTEIIAQIRTGDIETLRATLDELTKDRFINIGVNTPTPAFTSVQALFAPGVAPSAPTFNQASIPNYDMSTTIINYPIGSTPTTVNQDQQTYLRWNGPR
jgi:hypothetical protein